jgi:hypothetical protein
VHKTDIWSLSVERDEVHAQRFPTGLFTDELWTELGAERVRLDRAKPELAIRLVTRLLWLARQRSM